jgi:hypothetical protein
MSTQDKIKRSTLVQRRLDLRTYLSRIKQKMEALSPWETEVVTDIQKVDETISREIKKLETED